MQTLLTELPVPLLERKRWEGAGSKRVKSDQAGRHQHLDNWAHITTCKRVLNFTTLPIHGGSQ